MRKTNLSFDETQAAHALGEAIAEFVKVFVKKSDPVPHVEPALMQHQQPHEPRPSKHEEQLLSARMAAKLLNISDRTLWAISHPRGTIQTVRVGRRVLYPKAELMKWIEVNTGR